MKSGYAEPTELRVWGEFSVKRVDKRVRHVSGSEKNDDALLHDIGAKGREY